MAKYLFLALTNPIPGREDDYNEWYDTHHVRDVVNVPGFVSGQRFRLGALQFPLNATAPTHQYLALYEIETDDLAATYAEVIARIGTAAMISSDAMNSATLETLTFMPIGAKVVKNVPAQ